MGLGDEGGGLGGEMVGVRREGGGGEGGSWRWRGGFERDSQR